MFTGMAFYKRAILTGNSPALIYWAFCVAGLGLRLLVSYFRLQPMLLNKFNRFDYVKNVYFDFYEISRTLRSVGIFGLIMLLYKSGWFNWMFRLMRPAGQMAFTNYLMRSFICAVYFYGPGAGMFGRLQRFEIYYVVAVVWIIEIAWSHAWLHYFRFLPVGMAVAKPNLLEDTAHEKKRILMTVNEGG